MVLDLTAEPRHEAYRQLVEFCHARCARVSLVVREIDSLSEAAIELLEQLRPDQISVEEVSEWPGTKLLAGTALVYHYRTSPRLLHTLTGAVSALYDWVHPDRPEDPCFITDDGTAMLVSISHERDAYLELTPHNLMQLHTVAPRVARLVHPRHSRS